MADCQRTRLGGFAGLAALARFSGRAAGETRAVGKFPDADKASVERGETRREALFLLLRQALPVLCRSHVLQPLEYVIKGNIVAVAHRVSHLFDADAGICQQRMGDVHLGTQHMIVKKHACLPADKG